MCVSEHRMNNLSQMHVFDLFPWREEGRKWKRDSSLRWCLVSRIQKIHFILLMLSLFFSLTTYSLLVDNIYLSDVSCANCADGIHMFILIQFCLNRESL